MANHMILFLKVGTMFVLILVEKLNTLHVEICRECILQNMEPFHFFSKPNPCRRGTLPREGGMFPVLLF